MAGEDPHWLTLRDVREVLEKHRYKFSQDAIERLLKTLQEGNRVYFDVVYIEPVAPGLYAGYSREMDL